IQPTTFKTSHTAIVCLVANSAASKAILTGVVTPVIVCILALHRTRASRVSRTFVEVVAIIWDCSSRHATENPFTVEGRFIGLAVCLTFLIHDVPAQIVI
ncbi:hypothetical protein ACDT16_13925, partial [Staphylococcus aureus]